MKRKTLCAGAALTLLVAMANAASQDAPPRPDGAPSGPPPEAVAACTGKAEGAQVTFNGRGGEQMSGVCTKVGDVLAARPNNPPPRK